MSPILQDEEIEAHRNLSNLPTVCKTPNHQTLSTVLFLLGKVEMPLRVQRKQMCNRRNL